MPATRKSTEPTEIATGQRRDEIVAVLAGGLVRLIRARGAPERTPTGALASMPTEKLSESGEIGLELSRETRLSVPVG